jgi:hypothetical protein
MAISAQPDLDNYLNRLPQTRHRRVFCGLSSRQQGERIDRLTLSPNLEMQHGLSA